MIENEIDGLRNDAVEEKDFALIAHECHVDLSEEMQRPEILLSIGTHEYKGNSYPTPIMTSGEFSAIIAVCCQS